MMALFWLATVPVVFTPTCLITEIYGLDLALWTPLDAVITSGKGFIVGTLPGFRDGGTTEDFVVCSG